MWSACEACASPQEIGRTARTSGDANKKEIKALFLLPLRLWLLLALSWRFKFLLSPRRLAWSIVMDIPLSPYAQKVKLALLEKGVAFETRMPDVDDARPGVSRS